MYVACQGMKYTSKWLNCVNFNGHWWCTNIFTPSRLYEMEYTITFTWNNLSMKYKYHSLMRRCLMYIIIKKTRVFFLYSTYHDTLYDIRQWQCLHSHIWISFKYEKLNKTSYTVKPRPEAHMDMILFEVFLKSIDLISQQQQILQRQYLYNR